MSELALSLPHCPKNIPIIIVTMKGKDNSLKDVVVRKKKVEQALHWLIKYNPQYKNVLIDQKVLEPLPSDGFPSNISTIETEDPDEIDSHGTGTILTDSDADYEKEKSSFLPFSNNDHLESDAIKNSLDCSKVDWPSVDSQPFNEYTTGFLVTFAFPTLFPDGKGDPTNPCLQRDISFGNIIQYLLKYSEKIDGKWVYRFASHPRFSYWALNMIQRKRALQQNSIFLKQNPDKSHLTFEQLQEMVVVIVQPLLCPSSLGM